jgi:putative oxygen-independent coproporphyrinogen III oxidase
MPHAMLNDPLALYVHWPFCVKKCPYCDFNSHVRDQVDQPEWRNGLLADLAYEATQFPAKPLTSIFFGGGTPSLMPPETAAAVLDAAERLFGFTTDIEITVEANPSSVEAARFADLAAAGVNRVSLGLQALDDDALTFLGRAHDVAEGLAALGIAQSVFARVSFDLIYARPDQSLAAWEAELTRALSFGTEHLSLYQLTIEPGTRFATLVAQGQLMPVDPDHGADLFELTRALTTEAGLPPYEVSNHARPGAESRHNLTYWRYGNYLGVGPGAHGRRGATATVRHKKPENFLSAISRNGSGAESEILITPAERAREALLMGLRLAEGVDVARIADLGAVSRSQLLNEDKVALLGREGLLHQTLGRLTVTPKGMPLLDGILGEIVAI